MANITQKPNGTYLVRISCGRDIMTGKQILRGRIFKPSKPDLSQDRFQKELNEFIEDFTDELQCERNRKKPENKIVSDFAKEYLSIQKTSLSPGTYDFYQSIIDKHILPMFGRMRLRDIKTYHVQDFILRLNSLPRSDGKPGHIAPQTIKRYTTVLRSILTMAYKMYYVDDDVGLSRRLTFPKERYQEVDVFTIEEAKAILTAAKTEPINIRLLIEIALFTGMRRGEIVGLKWSDINLDKQCLSVKRSIYKPKGEKSIEKEPKSHSSFRTIAIPNCLCETLKEYKKRQEEYSLSLDSWKNLDYIFTDDSGSVMNPQTPTKQFSHFLDRHNIRHLKFHCLRHTSATILLSSGCDIKTVSARLGHSSIDTTNIYIHVLESVDRQAATTFENLCN
ncbi:MAG: site-specific integrase [Clostridia bacterium]|nr:site-specific integrase [Clostridia bacterium]